MHVRSARLFILVAVGFLTLSLIRGQERTVPVVPEPAPTPVRAETPPAPPKPAPLVADPARLEGVQRQFFLGASRGAEWLTRMNRVDGRFLNGWIPSLNVPLEGDVFHNHAGAAFALARAARLSGEERYTVCAARAILSLLDETVLDSTGQIRYLPLVGNRLGAASLLVLAINELPAPAADLLEKSEQLCNFLRRQARPDGSLSCGDPLPDGKLPPDEVDAINQYPGQALYAIVRSMRYRPSDWKLALVRNAVAFYLPWWRSHQSAAFVPWQTMAFAEAYLQTRDRAFADAVFEMSDWLTTLQYDQLSHNQHPEWIGGFRGWSNGRALDAAPTAQTADCAEGLALACRAARLAGDDRRLGTYGESLLWALQFVATLQYTEANTTHFVPVYRERLSGAVHATTQDGTVRIDHTQHAVSAMVLFVEAVVTK